MKKLLAIFVLLTMFLVTIAPDSVDARRGGGGFSSGKKTYQSNPTKRNDNVQQSTNKSNSAGTTGVNQKRGFFSGGLMKGLMIGGLAGMLFGSMFAGMGFLGNIMGLIINLLAVWVLIMVIMAIVRTVKKNRRREADDRDGRY